MMIEIPDSFSPLTCQLGLSLFASCKMIDAMMRAMRIASSRRHQAVGSIVGFSLGVGASLLIVHRSFSPVSALAVAPSFADRRQLPASRTTGSAREETALHMAKQKYNPFSSLFNDMAASALKSGALDVASNPKMDEKMASLGMSWEEVRSSLTELQTPQERKFRDNLTKGYGIGSPLHKLRLFDESNSEKDVRVTLYRDSASWCPYCQKVWTMLETKRIPFKIEKVNMRCYGEKPASFLRLQPSGNIPVAVIDGKTYGQSNDIMFALEELFPDHKSLKPPKGQEAKAQELLRLERHIFSAWMYWLTGSWGADQQKQEFVEVLKEVESALAASGPFFMGNDVTLVDLMFVPFLERMCASLLYFKGFTMRVPKGTKTDYPALNRWFDAMEGLESYQLTKSDYYTHCHDLPPQLGGCTFEDAGAPYERAIDGERSLEGTQTSWGLPLQAHNGGVEPDWDWAGDEATACREAVERVSANFENIAKFAARGAGRKGMPAYSAELADPNAVPNDAVVAGVDSILRTVCMAMLLGVDKQSETMNEIARAIAEDGGYAVGSTRSLAYLRDRVGVPRDMKLPAARQLRAHLNWAIDNIESAKEK